MKTLSQSLEDATRIIGSLHPPGRGATAFSDSPWSVHSIIPDGWVGMVLDDTDDELVSVDTSSANGDITLHGNGRVVVVPSRWPGGIGEEPLMGEPA
ncbi:hypothetical protein D9623_33700 (plasmid) [Azospirillum brasilense]|uniref:Uncharacterized protein n=1 Tax=Azospirillum brasilense TaxID=192 RepID=A0A4D8QUS2_AZOBR|nr:MULTISPECIES: hypothetical protein [Azospirillum]YP_001686865.1 hypothetical protein APCd_gp24 [Azospirillum phage Cd]MDW7555397.1 hypothetical protein [Azospirillum brasilense]MDW7595195.1 hypothetical protein [Azospirillum brasilense]MDW7630348.1 hypothetical protein [Azospirillum brasilense]MDX5949716.1 hypothetical protein [Azospirillum brasilense]OPH16849.1 hypothetical protein FE89_02510 [Azospirillum brasilense]